jgi:nitroreductase
MANERIRLADVNGIHPLLAGSSHSIVFFTVQVPQFVPKFPQEPMLRLLSFSKQIKSDRLYGRSSPHFSGEMSLQKLLDRHTIRNYDPTFVIPEDQLTQIIESARIAPTAYTVQDIDFLVCTNRATNQAATDAQLATFPPENRAALESRVEKFKVTNVITCDAYAEVILYGNERKSANTPIHAGIIGFAIIAAASEFGLDTMAHQAMIGKGAEKVYGIPEGTSVLAIAIGKRRPDAYMAPRQYNNKVTYIK